MTASEAFSYFFAQNWAAGSMDMADLLGGKGAGLSEMCRLGLSVPPGFILTTEVCRAYYANGRRLPIHIEQQVRSSIKQLEEITGKCFGGGANPMLVSVRSGAKQSMPGMMDTTLNVGLCSSSLQELLNMHKNNHRFVYDSYRRLIQMYSVVVHKVCDFCFEEVLSELKIMNNVQLDSELKSEDLAALVASYKSIFRRETGMDFPDDPYAQLMGAVVAVFDSWTNERAIKYRNINAMDHDSGTAVVIQSMVFGNLNNRSASGVLFSRSPSSGEDEFFGECLVNAQGEDVVAGIRTPLPIAGVEGSLEVVMPDIYKELICHAKLLEAHYRQMQEIEFTIEDGKLWVLQTRRGKCSVNAGIKIAMDMYREGLINKRDVILAVRPDDLNGLFHPMLDRKVAGKPALLGLPASPGSVSGIAVFDAAEAEQSRVDGRPSVLFRIETSPEDIASMNVAKAIVTSRGGMTSHAAVVARGMGKPCVCGASDMSIDYAARVAEVRCGGAIAKIASGDVVTVSGDTGEVFLGAVPLLEPSLAPDFHTLMEFCESNKALDIRANADTRRDCEVALKFGVAGVGLCRTEHMFFEEHRLALIRRLILAQDAQQRAGLLGELLETQREDFIDIFSVMGDLPVTVRLLDPPLHEFISDDPAVMASVAVAVGLDESDLAKIIRGLSETNPMLGTRGVRLGILAPEIYEMQIRAVFMAARDVRDHSGIAIKPEIMVPFVFCANEMEFFKHMIDKVAVEVCGSEMVNYKVGSMIELPRSAFIADKLAMFSEFFSFGTNDLTQTVLGMSRDDSAKFIDAYISKGIINHDPFRTLDAEGVGEVMRLAIAKAKSTNPNVTFGVCGEHGADPVSMGLFCGMGIDYVSCSPYNIPKVRLASAQAKIMLSDGEVI